MAYRGQLAFRASPWPGDSALAAIPGVQSHCGESSSVSGKSQETPSVIPEVVCVHTTHTHMHTHTCTHAHTNTCTVHIHKHMCMHAHTCAYTHAHAYTRAHATTVIPKPALSNIEDNNPPPRCIFIFLLEGLLLALALHCLRTWGSCLLLVE